MGNQKLSWTLLIGGAALFLYQMGEVLAKHSVWAEVWQPAGVGEILRTAGGALISVIGALGIKLGAGRDDAGALSRQGVLKLSDPPCDPPVSKPFPRPSERRRPRTGTNDRRDE